MRAKAPQSCPTLCDPMDCSLPGSSSMGFSRQEYWSGLPCPPPEDLRNPETEPTSLMSPTLAGRFFTTNATWEAYLCVYLYLYQGFPGGADSRQSACNAGNPVLIPGSGRSPGEEKVNPLQCSCPKNPMDSGAIISLSLYHLSISKYEIWNHLPNNLLNP